MSALAPSPWTHGQATEFGTFHANTIYAADGLAVAQVYELPNNTSVEEVDPVRWAGGLANARLIAAAPELLEALRYAETFIAYAGAQTARDRDEAVNDVLPQIRAAIAKATGGQ